jgi:hypothetical protein
MWPLIIGAGLLFYLYNKNQGSTTTTASNGASVTLPGLTIPENLQPLTSDDVLVARQVLDGSYLVAGRRVDSDPNFAAAAPRLAALQELFNEWGQVGRTSQVPSLRYLIDYE